MTNAQRRTAAAVILVVLAVAWLVLTSNDSPAALPVLLVAFGFSMVCAYLNLKGKL